MVENDDGWSDWVQPRHSRYLLKCCDCGLVHVMQFRVVKAQKGSRFVDANKQTSGLVIFRARRLRRRTMTKGWSNTRASRCRAAHMVDPDDNTQALCGSPVRTLVRPKGAPVDWCDHCEKARKRLRKYGTTRGTR